MYKQWNIRSSDLQRRGSSVNQIAASCCVVCGVEPGGTAMQVDSDVDGWRSFQGDDDAAGLNGNSLKVRNSPHSRDSKMRTNGETNATLWSRAVQRFIPQNPRRCSHHLLRPSPTGHSLSSRPHGYRRIGTSNRYASPEIWPMRPRSKPAEVNFT